MSQDKKPSRIFSVAALQEVMAKQQEQFGTPKDPNQVGVVLAIDLKNVIEDPDQPRQVFTDEDMQALIEDVKIRGIQAPIAVRPPLDGVYKIIHGARRYRAALAAVLPKVPVIVQSDNDAFDDYSQISENTKRAELHPLDIARFIQKRKDLGEKNKDIAAKLGERPEYVVRYLSLLSAPAHIMDAFHEGRVRGAESVWNLSKLYEKSPEAVDELLAGDAEITRQMIRDAGSSKTSSEVDPDPNQAPVDPEAGDHPEVKNPDQAGASNKANAGVKPTTKPRQGSENAVATPRTKPNTEPSEVQTTSSVDGFANPPDDAGGDYPEGVSGKAVLIATWDNQEVVLVPDEIPSRIGLVWIQNTETEELYEVNAIELTLLRLDYEGGQQ